MNLTAFEKARQMAARHRQTAGKRPFVAKKAEDRGSLYIYEAIGEMWWSDSGVTANKVKDALAELKGIKTLDIYVNSEGGDIFEAKAIHSQLMRFDAERVVHIDGLAASAATFIAMAGDRIITAPTATWMIHEVSAVAYGRAADMRAMAEVLDMENRTFAETYAKRTGQSIEDVLVWMNAETWMNAELAKERGFTDEVSEEEEEDEEEVVTARAAPVISLAAQTAERCRMARQAHRLQQMKNRGTPPHRASGKP